MTAIEFGKIKEGEKFASSAGEFIKVNNNCAKRTEDHWKNIDKIWRFSPISTVYA